LGEDEGLCFGVEASIVGYMGDNLDLATTSGRSNNYDKVVVSPKHKNFKKYLNYERGGNPFE
jgi:hypothetical protein